LPWTEQDLWVGEVKMKVKFIVKFVVFAMVLSFAGVANAVLSDYGTSSEYFFDSITGLYWYDPVEFLGQTRAQVDQFITDNPDWEYGVKSDLDNFVSNYPYETPPELPDVIGSATRSEYLFLPPVGYSIHLVYWDGYLSPAATDKFGGVLSVDEYSYEGFDSTVNVYSTQPTFEIGAWIKSAIDPITGSSSGPTTVPEPSSLLLLGTGLIGLGIVRKKLRG